MPRIRPVFLSSLTLLALCLATTLPASAQQQQQQQIYVQCAVESYSSGVILTANAINNPALINQDAAACTDLIADGDWFGVDQRGSWRAYGYVRACDITLDRVRSIDLWAVYGDPTSAYAALAACQSAADSGSPVRWIGQPGV